MKEFSQIEISWTLGVSKQRVNYFSKTKITPIKKRRPKLEEKLYIDKIIDLARDKTTSKKSSSKIKDIINSRLKRDGKDITI